MIRMSASALALALLASAAQARTVNVALNADIRSTHPGVNRDDTDAVARHMVDASRDGLTCTLHQRKGVKFHNGAEMISAAALWSWNRYMDAKTDWIASNWKVATAK